MEEKTFQDWKRWQTPSESLIKSDLLFNKCLEILRVKIVPRIMWLRSFMDQNDIKNDDA